MLLPTARVFLSTSPAVLRRGSFLLPQQPPAAQDGGAWFLAESPKHGELPALGRLHSAQGGDGGLLAEPPKRVGLPPLGPDFPALSGKYPQL